MQETQIALSKDFMAAYSRLPKQMQRKVRRLTEKFQENPGSYSINLERLHGAVDDKVRSLRVDKAYRLIAVHPPRGDVYLFVWVDHHDEAYDWVRNRRFEVNPQSGAFQIYREVEAEVAEAPTTAPTAKIPAPQAEPTALFEELTDEDLILSGLPRSLLPAVRRLITDDDLDRLSPDLPEDAGEMLYLLAAGYSLTEAIEEAERSKAAPAKIDPDDFSAALAKPESQRVLAVVEGEQELERMLDAPLEQWRIFLHPTQRKLVKMQARGPVRVLGGAGTGKTVVLLHRAKHLLDNVFTDENDRLLVTTFTRNLALDLKQNLAALCGDSARRVDVRHLHSWADGFMRKQGHKFRMATEFKRKRFFNKAIAELGDDSIAPAFYWEEWDRIIQPQDVKTRSDYLTARRVGRGTPLSRRQRAAVWPVFKRYRELLDADRLVEWQDLIRETRLYIDKKNISLPYASVLADEVQDFTANDLKLLRTIAPEGNNTLFLVGDGHQRIYGQPVVLGRCGIEIRGRSRRLKLSYRTTEQICTHAMALLQGRQIDDLDEGLDSLKGYCSLRSGPRPVVQTFKKETEEAAFIVATVKRWLKEIPAENICIASRTNRMVGERYAAMLEAHGIANVVVKTNPDKEGRTPGVRLATMHRMKGLEFSRVLLAGVHKGKMPLEFGEFGDEASLEDHELRERSLLYVACTRARDELVIAGYGQQCPFF